MNAGPAQERIGVARVAVPASEMLWGVNTGAAALRLLSVRTSEPLRLPATVGAKLMESAHDAPAANVPGVAKLLPITGQAPGALLFRVTLFAMLGLYPDDGIGNVRSALPMFSR